MGMGVKRHIPAAFYPGRNPVSSVEEAE